MRVLLTNDDGVDAPGIQALVHVLKEKHEVTVVAPDGQRSAASQGFTFGKEYRVDRRQDGFFVCSGSPVDCAMFGCEQLGPFDVLISGINHGANVGGDTAYSGTVGAAFEGARRQIAALAVSLDVLPDTAPGGQGHYIPAAEAVSRYLDRQLLKSMAPGRVLNINFPNDVERARWLPRQAALASEPYYQQILVCIPRGEAQWTVHVEHRDASGSRRNADRLDDIGSLQTGPVMTFLYLPGSPSSPSDGERLNRWMADF